MKKLIGSAAVLALMAGMATAEEVKIGVLLGFTGPLESITPTMAAGAELAMAEVSTSGKFMGGSTVTPVRSDSTCVDSTAAAAAAERLVTADGVKAIVGADCSGVTGAVLQGVARPQGIGMISPSSTSPALSTAEDDGLFLRTAPSDARQGQIMSDILTARGVKTVALTYTNNDYGKGMADAFAAAFTAAGGTVTATVPHEDGKGVIQSAVDTGAFSTFFLPDGMYGESLIASIGDALNGSYGSVPGTDSEGAAKFAELAKAANFDPSSSYAGESYDAAALMLLSMAAANSTKGADWTAKVMDIANGPGEVILPGELGKALELIAAGKDIDYVGATSVELIGGGESAGNFREFEIKDGKIETVGYR